MDETKPTTTEKPSFDRNRITAFIIDMVIASLLNSVLMVGIALVPLVLRVASAETFRARLFLAIGISCMVLILKDCLPKNSIGKRAMHVKIIDKKSGNDASIVQKSRGTCFWL